MRHAADRPPPHVVLAPDAPGPRRRLLRAGVALAAAVLAGCAGLPPSDLIPPIVSVADVGIDQVGLSDISMTVTLEIVNPNGYELPLRDLRADLELIGRAFGSGWAREVDSVVPPKGRRSVPMTFVVPTTRLLDLVRAFRLGDAQRIGYRLSGTARWGEHGQRIAFERAGDLQAWIKALDGLGPLLPR